MFILMVVENDEVWWSYTTRAKMWFCFP